MSDNLLLKVETSEYLEACARIRGITLSSLLRRLVTTINSHMMVGNILDDADDMKRRNKSEHRHREASHGRDR